MIRPMTPPTASHPPQTTALAKLRLLLWKNYLIQKRHKIHTLTDIFLPVAFFMFCAWLQKLSGIQHVPEKTYPSLPIDDLNPLWNHFGISDMYPPIKEKRLIFTPNNDIFKDIMAKMDERLGLTGSFGVDTNHEMEKKFVELGLIAGIVFHHSNATAEIPKSLSYSLRFPSELRRVDMPSFNNVDLFNWQTGNLFPADSFSPRFPEDSDGGPPSYYKEGFLAIQNAIADAFIKTHQSSADPSPIPAITLNRFPYPAHTVNLFVSQLNGILALFVLLSLTYTFTNTVRFISIEKEKQLKEAMKIMGLANWMHYLSWFIRTIVMLTFSMVLIAILLKWPWFGSEVAIFPNSSFLLLMIFLIGYCICLITMAFVICATFQTSKSAMTASTVVWYATWSPYFLESKLPKWMHPISCICPNTAMSYGFRIISHWEDMGTGLTWSTAFQTDSIYSNITVATTFVYLIITAIILFFVTLYMENVIPGGYGVAKPWYFLCTKDFWQSFNNYQQFNDHHTDAESFEFIESNANKSNFESEPVNRTIGIEIRNLTKKFSTDKAAVSNLTLNIYNNQITCLLGQNGAGKTTTISMLTGMMEATTGTAIVNGYDIRTKMDKARSSMGFCPQHNILFDELTVHEHIIFYCNLKGLSADAAESEARKYGRILELSDKMDTLSTDLSGGMKRKLSVVIALCGHSKIVFLDEPTSGMDPGARRTLWDILLAEKKDRTILLTTHFMDEADVLSDRIAILADGELKCAGSTFFLKKRFGTGYHLICAKDEFCVSKEVTELLQNHIPDIRLEHENDTEISYLLPEDQNEKFQKIFEDLENNEDRLNIGSFGVSLTTLEEIFLKIGKSENFVATPRLQSNQLMSDGDSGVSDTRIALNDDHFLLRGPALWKNQSIAMLKKRYLCFIRSILSFLLYNLFVVFMLTFVIFEIGNLFSKAKGLPSLDITFDKYKSPYTILEESNSTMAIQYQKDINQLPNAKLLTVNSDMEKGLLGLAHLQLKEFKFQYLVAASFLTNNTIIAWFNNQAIHTAALTLNLVHNAIARTLLGGDDYSIKVMNAPFAYLPKNDTIPDVLANTDGFGFFFSIMVGVEMSIFSAWYIQFYIKEKEGNAKFMQYASGAYMFVFWGASIIFDLFLNTITICIIIVMLAIGQHDQWDSPSELAIVFLIMFLYNFAMMPVIGLLSLLFTKPSTGMNVISIANMVLLFVFMLNMVIHFLNKPLYYIFWSFPLCTMTDGLIKLPQIHTKELTCDAACKQIYNTTTCDWDKLCQVDATCCSNRVFAWSDEGIGKNLALMIGVGIISFVALVFIESGLFKFIKSFVLGLIPRTYPYQNHDNVDNDVRIEKERIDQMTIQELKSETMVMQNVSKFYGQFCAVNQISVAVKKGECFGLLGKNGAGKSSIFKMLTGETIITSGEIYTQGYNQKTQLPHIYQLIGYCPQFDALLTDLTCRETLEIFAMLRGIPYKDVKNYIENCARRLDFIQHIDKKVAQLSGGNKRKLSTSLAIIGNLSVIFLDEPTTGMDPATKRNLWNVVIQSREAGKSIVLTSHSMEECEALCTRMTVLVNGLCKCLGSSQHLKNKFTKGFELKIKVKDDETKNMNIIDVKNFILQTFNGAIFREEYQGILTYSIPVDNIRWSSVFGIMANAKKTMKIEDYSVSQNSLEQVVLTLVKDQECRQNQE